MMDIDSPESRRAALLERRQQLTNALKEHPHDAIIYLRRALVYADLAYPDLAIGDAYRALLLTDEVIGGGDQYFEQVADSLLEYTDDLKEKGLPDVLRGVMPGDVLPKESAWADGYHPYFCQEYSDDESDESVIDDANSDSVDEYRFGDTDRPRLERMAKFVKFRCYQIMSLNLLLCGCLRSANSYCQQGLAMAPSDKVLQKIEKLVKTAGIQRMRQSGVAYNPAKLPDRGLVRREVYPWNTHEPDRCSPASLAYLNKRLAKVAPKCEVRAVQLPVLTEQGSSNGAAGPTTCWQLGVFAKEPIAAGEVVLREYSLLTANNRHKDASCDACGSAIPDITSKKNSKTGVSCNDCDVVFCGKSCYDRAFKSYHSSICDTDVDNIAKDPEDPRDADDALYVLLVERLLAMSDSKPCHPLDAKQVKYLWGDFVPVATNNQNTIGPGVSASSPDVAAMAAAGGIPPAAWSLPFNFQDNIARPLHIMDEMALGIFEDLDKLDVWVINTLYAKFRGTASARKSRQDGRPDVAAVHPLWCLANHDCDPNVTWEWGGRMVLSAKAERVQLAEDKAAGITRPGGIAAGEEILNHYCDIDLPVQLRREWASGSLGGICMCQRCQNESAAEQGST
ncbi:hypothetical protein SEPCBS119000_000708 [Sporothrix epigloea]|uniref:SET domain-containing protein n=1 Tax=Sporothrix epigloea TaxID=1892477 RepID=A0ABP0D854_9PEZI